MRVVERRDGARQEVQRLAHGRSPTAGASSRTAIADEVHKQQRNLRGVARTKLAFSSDRDGVRMKGPVGDRDISNIYMSDYDGANQTRLTVDALARHRARVVARRRHARLHVVPKRLSRHHPAVAARRCGRRRTRRRGTVENHNFLPAWSPDGTQARLHVEPRRQPRDLHRQPRRHRSAPDHESPDRRRRRRPGRRPARSSRSRRIAAAARRSTS